MVDMVEARKRAKAKAQKKEEPPQAKPVVRSEQADSETPPAYFPVQTSYPAVRPKEPPEAVSAAVEPEDQVDFLQRLLAEEPEEVEAEQIGITEEELEVLVFQLGNERYGMDIHRIVEIIRFVEPTRVPHTVAFLDGIISLRGRMIPVINGRKRMGHDPRLPDKKSRIIVLNDNSEYQGILVDAATQVVHLPKKNVEPTPPVVPGVDAEFIEGVCQHKGHLIILLNLDRFLRLV